MPGILDRFIRRVQNAGMKFALALFGAVALGACTPLPDRQAASDAPLSQEGPVALGQTAQVGALAATPVKVVEDSRCPRGVQCVWAGRVVLQTLIESAGWRETVSLTLGKVQEIRGTQITLASVTPQRMTEGEVEPADYRFSFEGGL